MLLFFTKNGKLKKAVNNDEITQFDTDKELFVHFDDIDTNQFSATLTISNEDGTGSPLVMYAKDIIYNDETFSGFNVELANIVEDEGGTLNYYSILNAYGRTTFKIDVYYDTALNKKFSTGNYTFIVRQALEEGEITISKTEYYSLIRALSSKVNVESGTSNNQTLTNATIDGGNISNSNLANVTINEVTIGEQNSVEKAPTSINNIANKGYVDSYTETRVNEKLQALLDSGFNGLVLNNLNMNNPTVTAGTFTHSQLIYVLINGGNVANCTLLNCYVNDDTIRLENSAVNKKYVDSVGSRVSAIEESYVTGIKTPKAYTSFTSGYIDLTSEFNKYLSIDGGTIFGNLDVKGAVSVLGALNVKDLFVSGTMTAINSEELVVKDKVIIVGAGNQSALTSPAGFVVPKYDGENYGGLFFDHNGNAYVGDVNLDSSGNIVNVSAMPLATRKFSVEDSSLNGKIAVLGYDDETKAVYLTESDKTPNDLIRDVIEQDRITKEYVDSRIAESIYNALLEDY